MATAQRQRTTPITEELGFRPGPRQILFAAYAWALLALLAIPLWLGVVLLPEMAWRWRLVRGASLLLLRLLGIPVSLRGEAHLARCPPCVIVANHASYADSMVLVAALPGRLVFTPTRLFERHFLIRVFMSRLGSLFVGGGGPGGDAERITALVQAGESVVVFPEGAVHPTPGLRPFRSGAFVAAVQAHVPVLPVVIRGSRRLFRHRSRLPRWSAIAVLIQPPLWPVGEEPEEVDRLLKAAYEAILGQAEELSVH